MKFSAGSSVRVVRSAARCLKNGSDIFTVQAYDGLWVRLEKHAACVCQINYCGGWMVNRFKLVDHPDNPDKTAHPVCKYALGKAVPVEPVSERLYLSYRHERAANASVKEQHDALATRAIQHAQRGITAMPVCNITGQPVDIVAVHLREIKMKGTGKTTYEAQFKCHTCYENYDSGEGV